MIIGIASILFVCVAANHLGLIEAIEKNIGRRIPIVNCPKCSTFWFTLIYGIGSRQEFLWMLAVSFFCAYLAIWLELLMGIIDTLYNRVYEKIYSDTENDTDSSDFKHGNPTGSVS